MNLMLRSIFNLRAHRATDRRIAVLVDTRSQINTDELVRCLRPWSSWLTIAGVFQVDGAAPAGLVETLASGGCQAVLVIGDEQSPLAASAKGACARLGLIYVGPEFPPADSRELGLMQEVVHHDSELGGFNEWTKGDPQASSWVLRMFSTAHCVRQFPAYAVPYIEDLWQKKGGRPLETIDVGCGAVSRLRWGALNGFLRVTGVDPLLDMYAVVLERHGLAGLPSLRCAREVSIGAEAMTDHLPAGAYDFAYSSNALDHTEDPARIVRSLAACVRHGGLLALEVFTREGSRENWWQLHQFDMYLDERGQFVCESRDKKVIPLFPAECGFEVLETPVKHDTVTAIVARRV
jgi:SAM-dependent methyltransferase